MKILKFIALMLILVVSTTTCKDKSDNSSIEISLTKYSLEGTSCQWQWIKLKYDGTIIMVNSDEELSQYIICNEGNYPFIDFSKNSLLLTGGGTTNGVHSIDATFTQVAMNQYILKVTVHLTLAGVAEGWSLFALTPRIDNNANITLDVQQTFN